MSDTERYDFDIIKNAISLTLPKDVWSSRYWFQLKEDLEDLKNNRNTNDMIYSDILNGKYDDYGHTIYRVFRDEYGMILKCTYICDGVFFEVDLNKLLTGNAFRPVSEWKKTKD